MNIHKSHNGTILALDIAWENSQQLATLPLVSPPNDVWGRLRKERRNSILTTRHYPDLASASDWSCRVGNLIQPIRSTTQIWVVTRHKYGISALVSQTSFGGETSGSVAKCRLFSQATLDIELQKVPKHTIMLFVCNPNILHKHCFQFLLGVKMAPRETENNAYAKFLGGKEYYGMLW